jgi:hypothetical protein
MAASAVAVLSSGKTSSVELDTVAVFEMTVPGPAPAST